MQTDVIIVGKGIAAMVLAFLLKQKGISHVILDRKTQLKHLDLAETLPPSAMPLLQSIGLLKVFEKHSIRKTYGYHSLWGSEQVTDHNFYFHHPFKYGLKINKKSLLADLENIARSPLFQYEQSLDLKVENEKVALKFKENKEVKYLQAKFIIDATGRNRAILKLLNIPTEAYDHNLSFTTHLPKKKHPRLKHDVFVESFDEGWGLVSGLNESQNVLSIFTHQKSSIFNLVSAYENWENILQKTKYLSHFLMDDVAAKVTGKQANSSRPEKIAGAFWMAIGDAALAFDPLCSHGISNAVYTSKKASEAIIERLDKSDRIINATKREKESKAIVAPNQAILYKENLIVDHFSKYHADLVAIFDAYLKSKNSIYQQEQRWKEHSYWLNLA